MNAGAAHAPNAEVNVTPMLDVLLVLLIIFMAVSIQVHHTMDVQLPISCAGTCDGQTPIVLEVLPGSEYRVNHTRVAPSELLGYLAGVYRGRPSKILQVAGYPNIRYEDVVRAMDLARSAGVIEIGIAPKESYIGR